MVESDVLLTIAEVAVAFAGFASLVGILGHRTSVDDPRVLGVRMRAMLLSSLLVVAFAILPIIVARYGASPDFIWTASSLVLLAATWSYLLWLVRSLVRLGRSVTPNRIQRLVILPTLQVTATALAVGVVANVVLANPAVYLTTLALLLFQSGFAFCLIVFSFLPRLDLPGESSVTDDSESPR